MRRRIAVPKPTLIDKAVAWVSPAAGLTRMRARATMAAIGGYVGARRDRASMSQWAALSASADADLLTDLDTLRSRSRDLVRNDPLAQSAVATKVVNVIGVGHVCRPEIDHDRLGITPAAAETWEELALDLWTDWASSPDCDVARVLDFAGLEDLVYRSKLLSGDVFVVRRFKERQGRLLGTCWQVIEGDRVSNPNWGADSETLAGGVALDADGAAVAYHIANRHGIDRKRSGAVSWQRVPSRDAQGRPQVLHIHGTRWRPEMTRYAPLLAPVIESLKQRSRYSEAELMAAVVSACFAIGMKSNDGDLGSGLQAAGTTGSDTGSAAKDIRITEPGQIFDLLPDEEITNFQPGRPNPQFAPFIDAVAREIGAGTDLPYELLVKQFQASYSASRAAMEMAWQVFRTERARHVAQFCLPVYEAVIGEAVARALLVAPGFITAPLRRRAWLGAQWMGPARPTIDPVKDAKADETYLDMGVTSLTRISAERFGTDYRVTRRRRAQDGSDQHTAAKAASAAVPGAAVRFVPQEDPPETDLEDENAD